jgi:hypothetical protein
MASARAVAIQSSKSLPAAAPMLVRLPQQYRVDRHPMPACKIVAMTLAPALDSAFMVSLIAATGVVNAALAEEDPVEAGEDRRR